MNVWELLLTVLGWILLFIAGLVAVMILLGTLNWIGNSIAKTGKPKHDSEDYLERAVDMGKKLYMAEEAQAFYAGARWGWAYLHKGRKAKK